MKMKIINPNSDNTFDINEFNGLVVDNEGDVWIMSKSHAICLSELYSSSRTEAIHVFSPFKPFSGKISLEND